MRIQSFLLIAFWLFISCTIQKITTEAMESWQYPYPVQYLETSDSTQLAYVEQGKGKTTLLFLHGLGSNLQAWQKTIAGLSSAYHCIAIDLPGYGKSSKKEYPFSMAFFAKEVGTFVQKAGLKKVVLVGHSMGGQIAMQLAISQPELVERLILIAPAGFETFSATETQWLQQVYTAAVVKATSEAQIVKNFELNFYDMPADARFMIQDRLKMRQSAEYDYYCHMIPQCVAAMLDEPIFGQLSQLQHSTLVLYGENDALIPNTFLHKDQTTHAVAKSGTSQLPNAQLQMIPEAGHFLQWEQDERVRAAIMGFLR